MQRRITAELALLVCKMLDRHWPADHVARVLRISPATVSRIARGSRTLPPTQAEDPWADVRDKAQRCGGCGALAYVWPCLTCAARRREELRRPALRRSA